MNISSRVTDYQYVTTTIILRHTHYFTLSTTPHNSAPERLGLPYDMYETENQQPEHLRPYFRERLEHYREVGKRFPRGFEYEKE
ncbi:DNA polymerase III subunit theta [Morganella morganii]|uniref:DNA polymerase III subunit theta n=1 Tax=Morganella morganii TaxID=582 RepID=UPI003B9DCEF2